MNADQTITEPGVSIGTESMTESSIHIRNETDRNYLDIITLIRSIQRSEGNPDCFLRRATDCDRMDCAWRAYCLGKEPKG